MSVTAAVKRAHSAALMPTALQIISWQNETDGPSAARTDSSPAQTPRKQPATMPIAVITMVSR